MFKRSTITNVCFLALSIYSIGVAQAQTLQGHLEETSVVTPKLKTETPRIDTSAVKEHCRCMDPDRVEVVNIAGNWKLIDRELALVDFGGREDAARDALNVVRFYGLNQTCTLSQDASEREMHFFLRDGKSPEGSMKGEDALPVDQNSVKAEQVNGRWKVTSNQAWMLDFGSDEQTCKQALEVIKYHGFLYQCFIGKPGRSLMYFRR